MLDIPSGASSPMPQYLCHKKVWALKIKEIVFDIDLAKEENRETDGRALITPENPSFAPFVVEADYVSKHKPQAGGYYVQYEGGYKSWSPAKEFEEGYSLI
jgi:hypothetical protein